MKNKSIKKMTGLSLLTAVTVVLALLSNVTIGTVNLNLALIPIVVGACIYGPSGGLFLGIVDGALTCVAPSTLSLFMTHNIPLTIILCLLKTGLAGLFSGIIYQLLKGKNDLVAVILAALIVPIINTGIFLMGVFMFFIPVYEKLAGDTLNVARFILKSTLTFNFLIEFILNLILSPTIHRIIKYKEKF